MYFWGPAEMTGNTFEQKKIVPLIFTQFWSRSHLNKLDRLTPQDVYFIWIYFQTCSFPLEKNTSKNDSIKMIEGWKVDTLADMHVKDQLISKAFKVFIWTKKPTKIFCISIIFSKKTLKKWSKQKKKAMKNLFDAIYHIFI